MTQQKSEPSDSAKAVAEAPSVGPKAQGDIVLYALLAALSRFIPVPFVDDVAQNNFQKMMIKNISTAHELELTETDREILAGSTRSSAALKAAVFSAKTIMRRAIRKTMLFFDAKDAADTFSRTYHLGYLLDYAFQQNWVEDHPLQQLRSAIDTVCDQVDTSPVNRVVFNVFKQSLSAVGFVKDFLLSMVTGREDSGSMAEERPEEVPPEAKDLVDKIQTALNLMPSHYFVELRQRFADELKA